MGRQRVLPVCDVDDAVGVRGRILEPLEVLEVAAADVSDLARPVTSCRAVMSSGTMYEPEWPVRPVTSTWMLLLL